MADGGLVSKGDGIPTGTVREWAEPEMGGCEYFIPVSVERAARNTAILAEAQRKLTLDNFNTTPAIQPPALTED